MLYRPSPAAVAILPLLVAGAFASPCRDSFSPECSKNGVYNATSLTCVCAAPWAGPKCSQITHPGMTCDANTGLCQCSSATPVLDLASNNCRSRQASDCAGTDKPVLDKVTKKCRARQESDCAGTDKPVLDEVTKDCRVRQDSDCKDTTPVLDGATKECRARKNSDCAGSSKPILDAATKDCRVRQESDCAGSPKPILDGTVCRARKASDCTGTDKPVFNAGSGECQASTACPIDPSVFNHAGTMGTCTGSELAAGKTCLPTCSNELTGTGSVSCKADEPLENTFICSATFLMKLVGVTDTNWKDDEKIAEAFESALIKFLPSGSGREDILETDMKDDKVMFKLRVTKDGATETKIEEAVAAAVTEGTFTTAMQQSLESESVTSVDPKAVSASKVEVQPPDNNSDQEGNNGDTSNDGAPPSASDPTQPLSYIIPLVIVGILIVAAVVVRKRVYNRFRNKQGGRRASLGASNELTLESGASEVPNPLETGPAVAVFVGGDK